jgi:hypothetical protein
MLGWALAAERAVEARHGCAAIAIRFECGGWSVEVRPREATGLEYRGG